MFEDQKAANQELFLRCGADEASVTTPEAMTLANEANAQQDA